MKYLLSVLLLLCSVVASAAEKQVALPNDSGKLYVSLYVNSASEVTNLMKAHPEIAKYKAGNHFNIYSKADPMYRARFSNVKPPAAYVQTRDGKVVWTSCPLFKRWKENRKEQKQEEVVDDEQGEEDETPVEDDGPSHLLLVGLGLAALAAGAGLKWRDNLKGKK